MFLGQPIRQIAYAVNDVRQAAAAHAALFGSGPFFAADRAVLDVVHRGKEGTFDHNYALGQWGAMQVEFLAQNGPGPSIIRDLYPEGGGKTGLHHVALFVDDLEGAASACAQAGYPEVFRARVPNTDILAVMVDTVAVYGHFVELYEPGVTLARFYKMVADAAENFDGRDPVREMKF